MDLPSTCSIFGWLLRLRCLPPSAVHCCRRRLLTVYAADIRWETHRYIYSYKWIVETNENRKARRHFSLLLWLILVHFILSIIIFIIIVCLSNGETNQAYAYWKLLSQHLTDFSLLAVCCAVRALCFTCFRWHLMYCGRHTYTDALAPQYQWQLLVRIGWKCRYI